MTKKINEASQDYWNEGGPLPNVGWYEDFGEPISVYSDAQAREDGVLVAIGEGPVNRVTRAVFDHFTESALGGAIVNITPLMEAIRAILKIEPDDGWRVGTHANKKLWAVPNEVNGLTLMFPEDY